LGPSTARTWPGSATRSSPSRAVVFPNRLTRPSASMVGVMGTPLSALRDGWPIEQRSRIERHSTQGADGCQTVFESGTAFERATVGAMDERPPANPATGQGQAESEPPWRPPARGAAVPRAPITREAIVEAALTVMDREGVDGLSMRRVA